MTDSDTSPPGILFRGSFSEKYSEWRERAVAAFWRIADKRIPKEWLYLALGGMALLLYMFVLFFGTRPRK